MNAIVAAPRQVNLYNPELLPKRESFSARQIAVGVVIAAVAMVAVAGWALSESAGLRREMSHQAQYQAARTARAMVPPQLDGRPVPTPEQVAALEQALKAKHAQLEARRAARDALRRGVASPDSGPSALMRLIATSVPREAWMTELRVAGSRFELAGRATDPAAVENWLARLRASGFLADKPTPTLKLERAAAATSPARAGGSYTFTVTATLASPFAEEGKVP